MRKVSYLLSIALLIATLHLSGCFPDEEPIEAGLQTSVSGKVYEYNLQMPEEGCTVYIVEAINDSVGLHYLDSTVTDTLGNYELAFTTTGKGYLYWLELKLSDDKNFWYGPGDTDNEISAGRNNAIDLNIARLSVLKTHIIVTDNPHRVLQCKPEFDLELSLVIGEHADTTLYLPVIPNVENQLYFSVLDDDSLPMSILEKADTIDLTGNFEDTVNVSLELSPLTFERRQL